MLTIFWMFSVVKMKVIKKEPKVLWMFETEDDLFTYDTPLRMTFNEFNRLSGMNDDLFTYEVGIPGLSCPPHGEQQCDDLGNYHDLDVFEPQVCYDKNEGIYAKAVIFVNKRLVRLMDVTIEQWLDLMYGDHRIVDQKIKEKMTHGINADMEYDPSNVDFAEWVASKFSNHSTMDWYMKNVLWMYWIRGDDEEVLTDEELFDLKETYVNEKDEIAEINKDVPWVPEEPWSENRVPYEIIDHFCIPFLEDGELKDEALIKKRANLKNFETLIHLMSSGRISSMLITLEPMLTITLILIFLECLIVDNEPYHDNEEEEQYKEGRCELLGNPNQEPPTCKIERFEVIKYSFGPAEEFVAIKECGYNDWIKTEEDACHAYRDIFAKMDEGWYVTRAE
ncbi:hypothetical protein Tco_0967527 [Tanacetum coccineum]